MGIWELKYDSWFVQCCIGYTDFNTGRPPVAPSLFVLSSTSLFGVFPTIFNGDRDKHGVSH